MSKQNIFDDQIFFEGYKALRDGDFNANDLIEQPAMRKRLPKLEGKSVLDLGCGYGHNCIDFVHRGAKRVVGVDISEKMLEVAFSVILSSVTTLLLMIILINSITEGFFVSCSKCTVLEDNIILNKPWINIFRVDFTVIVNKVACLSIT